VRLSIAVSGKGGVGKTAVAALLIRFFGDKGPVLAVDADPDSNLPQALGVEVKKTVGEVREAVLNAPARSAVAQDREGALKRELMECIEEFPRFDLVVMGRSEGEGCYCPVNFILREVIDARMESYDFIVMDCEAGLEHLSRRTTRDIDALIVVTDPSKNGLLTARRVRELSGELHIDCGSILTVVNKVVPEMLPAVREMASELGLGIDAFIPYDPLVAECDLKGKPLIDLPGDSPFAHAVGLLGEGLLASSGCLDSL